MNTMIPHDKNGWEATPKVRISLLNHGGKHDSFLYAPVIPLES